MSLNYSFIDESNVNQKRGTIKKGNYQHRGYIPAGRL